MSGVIVKPTMHRLSSRIYQFIFHNLITLRSWLKRNKIFFETITLSSLTVMSVIVAINANKLLLQQNFLIEKANLPKIRVAGFPKKPESLPDITTQKIPPMYHILFYNDGGPLFKFSTNVLNFLEVKYGETPKTIKTVFIPLHDITYATFPFGNKDLVQVKLGEETQKVLDLEETFKNYVQKYNPTSVYLGIRRFVEVTYFDIYDKQHEEYYETELYSYSQIDKTRWDSFSNKFNTDPYLKFYNIDPQSILNYFR